MKSYISAVYNFCNISVYPGYAGVLGSDSACFLLNADQPFEATKKLNPDLPELRPDQFSGKILEESLDKDKIVWLYGTGEAAMVLSVEEDGDSLIQKIDAPEPERWPTYAWLSTTPDLERVIRQTSVRMLQSFFVNVLSGIYDHKLKGLPPMYKEFATNLTLRIAPHKLHLFESRESYLKKFAPVREDTVVLTAMAMAGDQRALLIAKNPLDALRAFARAGRLFRRWGDGSRSILEEIMERTPGFTDTNLQAALRLSNAEEHTQQSRRIKLLLTPEPPESPRYSLQRVKSTENIPADSGEALVVPKPPERVSSPSTLTRIAPPEVEAEEPTHKYFLRSLAERRGALGYDEDEEDEEEEDFTSPEPPKPLVRMYEATKSPSLDRTSVDDLRAELVSVGFPMAHLIPKDNAIDLLKLRKENRQAFDRIADERQVEKEKLQAEELGRLLALDKDMLRFRTVQAGLEPGDAEGLAELTVDPLQFRAEEKARKRAKDFQERTGMSSFDARRSELQRRLVGA